MAPANVNKGLVIALAGAIPLAAIATWLVMAGTVLGQVKELDRDLPILTKQHHADVEKLTEKCHKTDMAVTGIFAELRALKELVERIDRNVTRGDG